MAVSNSIRFTKHMFLQLLVIAMLQQMTNCARLRRSLPISYDQFSKAVTKNGYPHPRVDQYNGFLRATDYAGIKNKMEAAMFLAQLIHESGGLQFKEELAYKDAPSDPYKTPGLDRPGKRYYGRGYIQLTWAENYQKASRGIYGDDRLLNDPDQVARDENTAFLTAGWYWKTRVATVPGVKAGRFGESTRAINGVVECNGKHIEQSKRRFQYYRVVFSEFGNNGTPIEGGCYN